MKPQRLKQCAKCPWRKDVDPHEIPGGYCEVKHRGLERTIAKDDMNIDGRLPIMSCHEHDPDEQQACVGYMVNQIGPGNNVGLRLYVSALTKSGRIKGRFETIGEQHECFKDTLPISAKENGSQHEI